MLLVDVCSCVSVLFVVLLLVVVCCCLLLSLMLFVFVDLGIMLFGACCGSLYSVVVCWFSCLLVICFSLTL